MANMRYNIESGILKGWIGDVEIHGKFGSGGRSGSKKVSPNMFLANNSLATHIGGHRSKGTHAYGPIPRGLYKLRLHEKKENWIRLIPDAGNSMFGRDGFAIHGRGAIGSHGCLVPHDFELIKRMVAALKKAPGIDHTLEVVSIGPNIGWQNNVA